MSAGTEAAFHAAWREHERVLAEAALSGQALTPGEAAASSGLSTAARAHADASRPLEVLLAEYAAANAAAHEDPAGTDQAAFEALANELTGVRMAVAVLNGAFPGTGTVVTAGEGT